MFQCPWWPALNLLERILSVEHAVSKFVYTFLLNILQQLPITFKIQTFTRAHKVLVGISLHISLTSSFVTFLFFILLSLPVQLTLLAVPYIHEACFHVRFLHYLFLILGILLTNFTWPAPSFHSVLCSNISFSQRLSWTTLFKPTFTERKTK